MTPDVILVLLLKNTSKATSILRQLDFVISWAAWEKAFKHGHYPTCEHVRTWLHVVRQHLAALAIVCRHCVRTRLRAHRRADRSVSLQSLSCQCSGSHTAVSLTAVNCLGGHWWGSKWSSLPSPSLWQHPDSPTGIRFWPARGAGLWSPKRGHRHLTPRMLETLNPSKKTRNPSLSQFHQGYSF